MGTGLFSVFYFWQKKISEWNWAFADHQGSFSLIFRNLGISCAREAYLWLSGKALSLFLLLKLNIVSLFSFSTCAKLISLSRELSCLCPLLKHLANIKHETFRFPLPHQLGRVNIVPSGTKSCIRKRTPEQIRFHAHREINFFCIKSVFVSEAILVHTFCFLCCECVWTGDEHELQVWPQQDFNFWSTSLPDVPPTFLTRGNPMSHWPVVEKAVRDPEAVGPRRKLTSLSILQLSHFCGLFREKKERNVFVRPSAQPLLTPRELLIGNCNLLLQLTWLVLLVLLKSTLIAIYKS